MSEGLWSSSDRRVENAIDWARHLYQLEIAELDSGELL